MPALSHPPRAVDVTVGLDIGTTATKALAVDGDGTVLARLRLPHPLRAPGPDRLEHDATLAWVDGPRRALAGLVGCLGSLPAAVAVSALTPSLAAVDAEGAPLGPGVLYDDARSRPTAEDPGDGSASRRTPGGQPVRSEGGRGADPTRSAETARLLAWTAAHHPGAAYWPAQAVANRALGGPGTIDYATAVSSGSLFDGQDWDHATLARCRVSPAAMPSVVFFGEPLGALGAADWLGLSAGSPAPLLGAGSVDALCEQLVAGPLGEGDALVVLGSTLVAWSSLGGAGAAPGLWCLPQLDGGRWLVGGASNAGGLWADWLDRVLAPGDPDRADPERVPVWVPYLRGERVPLHDPSRRAGLIGADIGQGGAELRRAGFEASAFAARHILESAGPLPQRLVVTGGGSASPAWLQALADVMARPVEAVGVPEGAALGAAWLARMAAGLESDLGSAGRWARRRPPVEPRPAWVECAERRYRRFRQVTPGEVEC